jgi:ribosomal protein L44E
LGSHLSGRRIALDSEQDCLSVIGHPSWVEGHENTTVKETRKRQERDEAQREANGKKRSNAPVQAWMTKRRWLVYACGTCDAWRIDNDISGLVLKFVKWSRSTAT